MSDLKRLKDIHAQNLAVTRPLFLREFAAAFGDDYLTVTLNPSVDFYTRWNELAEIEDRARQGVQTLTAELIEKPDTARQIEITNEIQALNSEHRILANELLAQLWDCDIDAVDSIREHSLELFNWCITEAFRMIGAYGAQRKKN
jgi:hypothetical protein